MQAGAVEISGLMAVWMLSQHLLTAVKLSFNFSEQSLVLEGIRFGFSGQIREPRSAPSQPGALFCSALP